MSKTTAVISSSVDDFLSWRKDNICTTEIGTKTNVKVDDMLYILVIKPEHVCSKSFDNVIETENAHNNSEYDKIKETIKGNIKSN